MKIKWFLALVLLVVLLCGYLFLKSDQHIQALENSHAKVTSQHEECIESDYRIPNEGAHYPSLPDELVFRGIGQRLTLLKEAESRHEIVAWADNNNLFHVQSLGSLYFVVMGECTSGVEAWVVYLFGYYSVKNGDPKPWKMLYIGSVVPQHHHDIECIYIDDKTGSLVFANSRTGKVTKSLQIKQEIKMVEEKLGKQVEEFKKRVEEEDK